MVVSVIWFGLCGNIAQAQFSESTQKENGLLFHGVEQYNQGFYGLAAHTLNQYLNADQNPVNVQAKRVVDADIQKAVFYQTVSRIKKVHPEDIEKAKRQLNVVVDPAYRSHITFTIAQYYYSRRQLKKAIPYYERTDVSYLSNEEIADEKFELAYCYFNNNQFDKAKPLFAAIKDLPDNKYYVEGNYYYGLLAYNDKNYKDALESFKRIDNRPIYKDVVPYYEAEIYYFMGRRDKVLSVSRRYLRKDSLYYTRDMVLLTAQTYFEQKKYAEALPFFQRYYDHSNRIRKEELYELAYCHYRLKQWPEAIKAFQPLSNAHDSLGQTAMYLLGDCYLKINDKKGARHAFGICSAMNFSPAQKEAATFLYAKLSDELGYTDIATKKLHSFIETYPQSTFAPEAGTLLSRLLARSNNYAEAFRIMSQSPVKDHAAWELYQKVAVGRALQVLQNNQPAKADSIFNLSLQQPINAAYEGIAYFWKGDIAYRLKNYKNAINFSETFLSVYQGSGEEIEALDQEASQPNAQMIIGYAQMKLGDYSHAGQAFAQARLMNKNQPQLSGRATMNEADAYFMQRQYKQAKNLYQQAIDHGVSRPDYATFQMGIIDGLLGDSTGKQEILNGLINKQPASPLRSKALYELSVMQLNASHTTLAIDGFEELANSQTISEPLRAKALLKLAYAYQLTGNDTAAMVRYQKFLVQYPSDTNQKVASEALRSLYIAQGEPEQYVHFIEQNHLPSLSESVLENTFYDAAMQEFNASQWSAAVGGFDKYLSRFSRGENMVKVHFYRGVAFEELEKPDSALMDYDSVLANGWSDFSQNAAARAAHIAFLKKDYEAAHHYYAQLRDLTTDKQLLQTAYDGLMKTSFETSDYKASKTFADTLLTLPGLSKNLKAEGQLFKAKSLQKNREFDSAVALYKILDHVNIGAISAEARYRLAQISFEKGDYKKAEKSAGYAVQTSSGQDYWVVKCYILLGDILTKEQDYFNAKATLESVVKNTKIPSLKEDAEQKLEAVKALEKQHSKLKED